MISCPKCGKENQDHYKFCLGCGNELPRDGHGARPFQPTPPAGVPSAAGARPSTAGAPAVAGAPPGPAPFGGAPPGPPPGPAPAPFGGPPPGPAPAPFGGPPPGPAPAPFGGPPPGPAPAPFGGAPPGPALGGAGPFGGAAMAPPAAAPAPAAAGGPKIAATCSQCGSPNPRANRFCLTCGNDLGITGAASAPAPAPVAPPAAAPQPAPVAPPAAPAATAASFAATAMGAQPSRAKLTLIRPDGSEGGTFQLSEGTSLLGRDTGGVFGGDSYLSPKHATFVVNGSTVTIRDENSLNGVYLRVERQAPIEIRDNEVFRIGQEILHYQAYRPVQTEADGTEKQGAQIEGLVGRISLVIGRDVSGNAFPVPVTGLFLGRERGDILFPEDGYVSGLHCQLSVEGGKLMLTDVGSSNGTYVRLKGERTIRANDLLLLGQQLFRLSL